MKVVGFDHVVVDCSDVEQSIAWYCEELGLEPVRVEEWRRGEDPRVVVRVLCESVAPDWGEEDRIMTRRRHTPDQIIRKLAGGRQALGRGHRARRGVAASRDRRVDVASVGRAVRRHESQRREAVEGARGRERPVEAVCSPMRSSTRRCSRSWPRETSDPEPSTTRSAGVARSVRGLPTASVPGCRPAPLDRNGSTSRFPNDEETELRGVAA